MISNRITEILFRLNIKEKIEVEVLQEAFKDILEEANSQTRDVLLGALLTGIMLKGPTVNEIVALLRATLSLDSYSPENSVKITLPKNKLLVGAVGSGKKGIKTMNISTCSLLVASSVGAYTAKPGSSSTSSITGSADFMREVGANLDLSQEEMINVLLDTGIGFFSIENTIPNFDKVYGGRFYVPHALSFALAAILSPIKFDNLLYGLAHPDIELATKVIREFGINNAMVVTSTHDELHYIDEMGAYGDTKIIEMCKGGIRKLKHINSKEFFNLPQYSPIDIAQGVSKEENIKYAMDVLRGCGERAREDIVCINAGTLLYLSNIAEDLREGYNLAKNSIRKGKPLDKLLEFIERTNGEKKLFDKYYSNISKKVI
ncbi:hypothetical protein [Clostridium beijerinckii]|uniref:hypothetical protein n=1 Tax=Clostridium beijerinckii TaxID=1520 RepID=UPI000479DC2A|nr:hypothetical protein [Clostridium beijerinckii]